VANLFALAVLSLLSTLLSLLSTLLSTLLSALSVLSALSALDSALSALDSALSALDSALCSLTEMSELLFECYGAPSVCYGVDALFSYYQNRKRLPLEGQDGLIIASGHQMTHLILISGQYPDISIKRHAVLCFPWNDPPITNSRWQRLVVWLTQDPSWWSTSYRIPATSPAAQVSLSAISPLHDEDRGERLLHAEPWPKGINLTASSFLP